MSTTELKDKGGKSSSRLSLSETRNSSRLVKLSNSGQRARHYMAVREIQVGSLRNLEPVPWYVIDQDEVVRVCWDIASSILLIILIFWLPYSLTFLAGSITPAHLRFDLFVSVWFAIDIVLSFFTTYTLYGVKVTDIRRIASRYLRSYFLIDLVATVPWPLILSQSNNVRLGPLAKSAKFPRLLRALRTLRLGKLLRSREFSNNVPDLSFMFPRFFPPIIEQLVKFIAAAVVMNHVFACIWYALGVAPYKQLCTLHIDELSFPGNRGRRDCTWMQIGGYRARDGNFFLYTTCLYWSLTTISTVGYGDIVPNTAIEKIYASMVMVCGVSWYAVLVSTMGRALQEASTRHGTVDHSKTALKAYLYRHNVPSDLSAAIVSYLRHHFTIDHQFGEEDSDPEVWRLLKHLNKPLTRLLSLHVGRKAVNRLDFFRDKDELFVADAVASLRAYVASPFEVLVPRSTVVTALNLLAQGSCTASSPHYPSNASSARQQRDVQKKEQLQNDSVVGGDGDGDESQHQDIQEPASPTMSLKSIQAVEWTLHAPDQYFGDEGILLGAAWIEPLVANGWCELQIIPEATIQQLLNEFSDVADHLLNSAHAKLSEYPTILTTSFETRSLPSDSLQASEYGSSPNSLTNLCETPTDPRPLSATRSSSTPPLVSSRTPPPLGNAVRRPSLPRRSASQGNITLTGPPSVHRGLRTSHTGAHISATSARSFFHTTPADSGVSELREEVSILKKELEAIKEISSDFGGSTDLQSPSRSLIIY